MIVINGIVVEKKGFKIIWLIFCVQNVAVALFEMLSVVHLNCVPKLVREWVISTAYSPFYVK